MSKSSAKDMQRKKEQSMLASSNDLNDLKNKIQATHVPYVREVLTNPIFKVTEQILFEAIARSDRVLGKQEQAGTTSDMASGFCKLDVPEKLIIQKLSSELSSHEWLGTEHAHATTMELLNTLSSYEWHAKGVLILSAFAINFGKFWLFAMPCSTDNLANSLALLKQLPGIVNNSSFDDLIRHFRSLNKLVKATLDVTKCMVEIKNLPSNYISEDTPAMSVSTAYFPIAVYWSIQSVVTCSSKIANLISFKNEYISSNSTTSHTSEFASLFKRIHNVHEHLKNQLDMCYQYMYAKKILQPLIYEKASGELQSSKYILLLISDLDIPQEMIEVLQNLYKGKEKRFQSNTYEILWIPVVDPSTWDSNQFEETKSKMKWQSLQDPVIEPALIKRIKETLNFTGDPIVVTLDPQGNLICPNAFHMMMIWGNSAFPFSSDKEKKLLQQEVWNFEIILDGIDASILEWMRNGKITCLYGSEDVDWIRTFTNTASSVARDANIPLEIVYVGKSKPKEQRQRMITALAQEKLSHFLPDAISIWLFWARLESLKHSKLQHNLLTPLTLDSSNEGWAVFFSGSSTVMAAANGSAILRTLEDFDKWKEDAKREGFVWALDDYLHQP
ncbi:hypothetical protein L6164_028461 [Bauhinia variegata]|uniref:Uncharacterized protein n=1 Tax=Bauhinia variegata TaxID=167791 RepID=A0ACB9L606_BAUVA|nr:hypothetical protein L6164_028461 [Bauhinia variegata]